MKANDRKGTTMAHGAIEHSSISAMLRPMTASIRLLEDVGCDLRDFQHLTDDPIIRRQVAFLMMSCRIGLPYAQSHIDEQTTARYLDAVFSNNKPADWKKYLEVGAIEQQLVRCHGYFDGAVLVYAFGLNGHEPMGLKQLADMFGVSERELLITIHRRCRSIENDARQTH